MPSHIDRPKLYVDENLSHKLAGVMRATYPRAVFRSHIEEGLREYQDVALINEIAARGFSAIITLDSRQLLNTEERNALKDCDMAWVGMGSLDAHGIELHAEMTSVLVANMPTVIDLIDGRPKAIWLTSHHHRRSKPRIESL